MAWRDRIVMEHTSPEVAVILHALDVLIVQARGSYLEGSARLARASVRRQRDEHITREALMEDA
jgi:hypothetical protein